MVNVITGLILFIISNSIKNLYYYALIDTDYHLWLIHVLSTLGFTTIIILLSFNSRRRIWLVTWYLSYSCLIFINANYFEFFGRPLYLFNGYVFISEVAILFKNLLIPLDRSDLLFVVDLPIFLFLLHQHGKFRIPARQMKTIVRTAVGMIIPALVLLVTLPVRFDPAIMAQIEDFDIISRYGIIGHNIFDINLLLHEKGIDGITYGPEIKSRGTDGHRPNIVLIQFESLDAHIVNYRYLGDYVAPFLHRLTTKSLYFPFTLCYRSLGGTSDCEMAVNNGIEPTTHFPLIMDKAYTYPNSMVKILEKSGYSAEAFHGNTRNFYNRAHAYLAMGYDQFFGINEMKLSQQGWGAPDGAVMNFVKKRLDRKATPFFASIITMSSHEPFNLPHFSPDHRFDQLEPKLTRQYFASVSYTDRVLEDFVTKIQHKYPDTYFFIYGDHTPYVINEGPFRRSVLTVGEGQRMEMVPLFIITPDGQSRREHNSVASYLDIAPTILHLAGVPYSFKSLGINLFDGIPLQQPVVFRGIHYNRTKLFEELASRYRGQE